MDGGFETAVFIIYTVYTYAFTIYGVCIYFNLFHF